MSKGYKVAVVGATGMVGREMSHVLRQRKLLPLDEMRLIASARSAGREMEGGPVAALNHDTVEMLGRDGFDFCLMAAGADVALEWAPQLAAAGMVVIDNSSAFRLHPDVPLVVPEVNGEDLSLVMPRSRIVANPNCSTAQMVMVLKPLHDRARIKRVVVSTYQSLSGGGDEAMVEWRAQRDNPNAPVRVFKARIADNVVPYIDTVLDDGDTGEEHKMVRETQKILDPHIKVAATCVRVPVPVGHAEALTVEFDPQHGFFVGEMVDALNAFPGVQMKAVATPLDCMTPPYDDLVLVDRVRRDPTVMSGLKLWVVANNLRKGAALNAVQIAAYMAAHGLK